MNTLREMLDRNAACFTDQLAIVCEGSQFTYGELHVRAHKLGSALFRLGARRQDRISILAMNCSEYFDVYAACQLAGFITATVNFRLAAPEIEYIVRDSDPKILIFEAQYADLVDQLRARLPGIEHYVCIGEAPVWAENFDAVLASGDEAGAPIQAGPDDYADLIYTSGTTGRPKGVIKTQRAELARARMFMMLDVRPNGRMLLMMPMFHCGSGSMYMAQQWTAGCVYLHRYFDPVRILEIIASERITITHMAPTMVQAVIEAAEAGRYDLSSLETICYTAAPMPVPLLKRGLALLGPVFVNSWGMTEGNGTVMFKHQHKLEGSATEVKRLASVGQALPDVNLRIVDDEGNDLPPGQIGELVVQSPTQMTCYWNNSAATLETLRDGWLHTGDMAYTDEQGFVFLVDRKKDMIISGGENIYCQEVEQALAQHECVADVAVIGVPDERWGEAVKAIVVLKSGTTAGQDELIEFSTQLIARYKRPKSIEFVTELPRLPSGKVNKVALRQQHSPVRQP